MNIVIMIADIFSHASGGMPAMFSREERIRVSAKMKMQSGDSSFMFLITPTIVVIAGRW